MKKVLPFIVIAFSLLFYCGLRDSPTAGNSSDVNTGTIYGKVVSEKDTIRGEVVVELFRTDTIPDGLKKSDADRRTDEGGARTPYQKPRRIVPRRTG